MTMNHHANIVIESSEEGDTGLAEMRGAGTDEVLGVARASFDVDCKAAAE
jgi:hypothetical protein